MGTLNTILVKFFDILFFPFRSMSPWIGMIFISLITSFFMLFIFRRVSNQDGIKRMKDKIKAHLLELRLFKDNMGVTLKAQGRIMLANLKYVGYNSKPMLVMLVPVLLILIQLNLRFGAQSPVPGDSLIVKVKLAEGRSPIGLPVRLDPPPQVEVETPPLRIEDESEIDWRIRALKKGAGLLKLTVDGREINKEVVVQAGPLDHVSGLKPGRRFSDKLFNPGESPLPSDSIVRSVEIRYEGSRMNLFGWRIHWLVVYFILSIVFGYAFKGVFKVEI